MDSKEIVAEAIKELKLQRRLIRNQYGVYDPTLYRAWVQNTIPTMLPILQKTLKALENNVNPEEYKEEINFAATIIGVSLEKENLRKQTYESSKKY